MAEYNNNCVEKMQQKMGPLSISLNVVQNFLRNNKIDLSKCFENWDLPNWFNKNEVEKTLWG